MQRAVVRELKHGRRLRGHACPTLRRAGLLPSALKALAILQRLRSLSPCPHFYGRSNAAAEALLTSDSTAMGRPIPCPWARSHPTSPSHNSVAPSSTPSAVTTAFTP